MAGLKQLSLGSGNNFIVTVSGLVSTIAAEENVRGSGEEIMPMSAQWIIIAPEENLKDIFVLYDLTRAAPKMCFKGRSLRPVCRGPTDAGCRGGWGPDNQGSAESNCSQSQQENTQHITCWHITGLMSRVTKCDAVTRCLFVVRLWVNMIGRKLATGDHPGFCLH